MSYDVIIEPVYESIDTFEDGLAMVTKDGKYGVVNYEGEEVVSFGEYFGIYLRGNEVYAWTSEQEYADAASVYTYEGNIPQSSFEVIYPSDLGIDISKYYADFWYEDGLSAVVDKETGLLGYIDMNGVEVIPCKFPGSSNNGFHNGYAPVPSAEFFIGGEGEGYGYEDEVRFGMIDKTGNMVVDCMYIDIRYAGGNIWLCSREDGGVDVRMGAQLIETEFESIKPAVWDQEYISNDETPKLIVKKDGLWGMIAVNSGSGNKPAEKEIKLKIYDNFVNLQYKIKNIDGRTMYPFRECLENMGANVSWDAENKIAVGEYNGNTIKFPIGNTEYWINDVRYEMDVPSFIDESVGRTYIPIRYAAEGLGFTVDWIEGSAENIISIY